METKELKAIPAHPVMKRAPQFCVRSNLRGGASLEACEKALEDWKRSYYKWYEANKYKDV